MLALTVYWRDRWLWELEGARVDAGVLPPRYILATPNPALCAAARLAADLYATPVTIVRPCPVNEQPDPASTAELIVVDEPDPSDRDREVPSTPLLGFATRQSAVTHARHLTNAIGTWPFGPDHKFAVLGRPLYRYSIKKNDSMLYGKDQSQDWLSNLKGRP